MRRCASNKLTRRHGLLCCIELFKALSDPTRIRIAALLAQNGTLCVCNLAVALDISEYNISRHLTKLKSAGVVLSERRGQWMYYSLAKPGNAVERSIQRCLKTCFQSDETIIADQNRLSDVRCGQPKRKKQ